MLIIKHKLVKIAVLALLLVALPQTASIASAQKQCGNGDNKTTTAIDLGCVGTGCTVHEDGDCNPIIDVSFAIIRFLSDGVGLVIVGSLIIAGIQFSSARGDPKTSELAQQRIQSSLVALLLFIFAYAILNYVIPAGFLK